MKLDIQKLKNSKCPTGYIMTEQGMCEHPKHVNPSWKNKTQIGRPSVPSAPLGPNYEPPTWDPGWDFDNHDCYFMMSDCLSAGGYYSSVPNIPFCTCSETGATFTWTPETYCENIINNHGSTFTEFMAGYFGGVAEGMEQAWYDFMTALFGNTNWTTWENTGPLGFANNCVDEMQATHGSQFGGEQPVLTCSFSMFNCQQWGGSNVSGYGEINPGAGGGGGPGSGIGGYREGGRVRQPRTRESCLAFCDAIIPAGGCNSGPVDGWGFGCDCDCCTYYQYGENPIGFSDSNTGIGAQGYCNCSLCYHAQNDCLSECATSPKMSGDQAIDFGPGSGIGGH